ncbi:MAG: ADP-ribosylglycohydrolase family protein [Saccharofermentanales bacterium]
MLLSKEKYIDKVTACWLGKNIGGTLGAPMEGYRTIVDIDGYTQTFDKPLPNDDLDIQLLWLIALEEKGVHITAERLGEYWQRYVTPHWAEYGIAKVNMKSGLLPPMSGIQNNPMFKNSNGAFIRSEIWACLAPGRPDIAVTLAVRDCIIDHGNGEGTWGEIFCAALQSCAFIESDIYKLIDIALSYIPEDCGVAKAVKGAIDCYKKGMDKKESRKFLLTNYRSRFFGKVISDEDKAAGFAEGVDGVAGYDCPLNIAIIILGLLLGEGNFDKTVLSTIYYGEDTDCTVGTAASIFGLIYGTGKIEKKWTDPIGSSIVTGCLNLGELGVYGDVLPQTIEEFTQRVYKQHLRAAMEMHLPCSDEKGFETEHIKTESLYASEWVKEKCRREMEEISFEFDFYNVYLRYGDDCNISENKTKNVQITIQSTYKTADIINMRWITTDEVAITPSKDGQIFLMFGGFVNSSRTIDFGFTSPSPKRVNRYILELTIVGRTTSMYIPVVLYNGNFVKQEV